MIKLPAAILIVTATLTALMAGLFFSYSISVSLGLGKLSDSEYIKAMQSINREIQNPLFFLCFFGVLIMLPVATITQYSIDKTTFIVLLAATLFYAIGVFGITVFANVPLNNQLDQFDLSNQTNEVIQTQRQYFETKWNYWNNIRTINSIIAIILVIYACVVNKIR